ncbi:MAG: DUF1559 domain-containing protein [Fuerstiella sp.]
MPSISTDQLNHRRSNACRSLSTATGMPTFRTSLNATRRRHGFSLLELIFVAGVVCVLVTLLLPAVQQAREAARRTQCKSRVAQLNIAISSYHDAHTMFPPGCVNETGPIVSKPEGLHTSWLVQILPMMDQKNIAIRHTPEVSVYDERHAEIRAHSIPSFLCPTDIHPEVTNNVAASNYAGVTGGWDVMIDSDNKGMFFLNSSVEATDIIDGSSNQIAIAEHQRIDIPSKVDLGWMSGTSATLRNGGTAINYNASPITASPAKWETTGGFSSSHTGGAQVGLADGSVRFISENIDIIVLQQLCDIQDGFDTPEF